MTKTLRLLALAAVAALSFSTTNVEATQATPDLTVYQASQDQVTDHQVSYSGGLAPFLASENTDSTCREDYDACTAQCSPDDSSCFQECQCWFAMCKGWVCN